MKTKTTVKESTLVRKIIKAVKEKYPYALVFKLADRFRRGTPDLMILGAGTFWVYFVEVKTTKGRLSKIQQKVINDLRRTPGPWWAFEASSAREVLYNIKQFNQTGRKERC